MRLFNLAVRGNKQHLTILSLSRISRNVISVMTARRPISDKAAFKDVLKNARRVAVLTGAGVSAESGVPTFRGEGGFWRKYVAQQLATPEAFTRNPSLVWEFYHYRRELVRTKKPNKAHLALADYEKLLKEQGKSLVVVTQNIDGLHQSAGSDNVLELHGSLFKTRCLKCGDVAENTDSPICPALAGLGAPDAAQEIRIATEDLPRCKKSSCGGLLRPHVIWFGEALDVDVLYKAGKAVEECDVCLVIGTSSVVYPAAMFAPQVAARGIPVAEFNIEVTPATNEFMFHFEGQCGDTVPAVLFD